MTSRRLTQEEVHKIFREVRNDSFYVAIMYVCIHTIGYRHSSGQPDLSQSDVVGRSDL
jgi:hypothetical protein